MIPCNDNGAKAARPIVIGLNGLRIVRHVINKARFEMARFILSPQGVVFADRLFAARPHPACPKPKVAPPAPHQTAMKKRRPAFIRGVHHGERQ